MILPLMIFLPIPFVFLIALYGDTSRVLRNTLILLPSIINFVVVVSIIQDVLNGSTFAVTLIDRTPFHIAFRADGMAIYMAVLVTFLWILTNIYAFGYMAHEHAQSRFFSALTLASTATIGIIFSANLITLFLFYELLTVAVYVLVIHEETPKAWRGGMVYGAYLITGGIFLLLAISMIYNFNGKDLTFVALGMQGLKKTESWYLYLLFFLFFCSFGIKSALMPLHNWLPIAMVAPTPVSAVLHAVAVVNMGLYGMIRVIYDVFGIELFQQLNLHIILGAIACITILVSAIIALRQKEIKAMLAYSTVNQLSYVMLGVICFNNLGRLGGILHIAFHSFMKITLFYCAGTIITVTGKKLIRDMTGLAELMPITMLCFSVAAIGIIGLPPVAGWLSKWYIIQGYMGIDKPIMGVVLLLSGIIELGFFSQPISFAYFPKKTEKKEIIPEIEELFGTEEETKDNTVIEELGKHKSVNLHGQHMNVEDSTAEQEEHHGQHEPVTYKYEAPVTMMVPFIITTIGSVIFGLWGFIPHWLAKPALQSLLGIK